MTHSVADTPWAIGTLVVGLLLGPVAARVYTWYAFDDRLAEYLGQPELGSVALGTSIFISLLIQFCTQSTVYSAK